MPASPPPIRANFGLLPEGKSSPASFVTAAAINALVLALAIYLGMTAKKVLETHKYEQTELIFPVEPPPPPKIKITPPKLPPPTKPPEVKLEPPKINLPKPVPQPEVKPLHLEEKIKTPELKAAKPQVVLAPQPKAALATAAAPAVTPQDHPKVEQVHMGDLQGVTPNPNATKAATVAAIGNPYGGMTGQAKAPQGVVGSTGIGNGTKSGSNAGVQGRVASAGLPGGTGTGPGGNVYGTGKVTSAGIPAVQKATVATPQPTDTPKSTNLEVLSKPPSRYTEEARALKIQGDVVLRVTFTANGQVLVQGVVHGLGHGLDEEARRVAEQIRFRPATKNGQAVDLTTNITISFQLA